MKTKKSLVITSVVVALVAVIGLSLALTQTSSAGRSGTLDDGKELLPQAGITLDQAIQAAQTAASGAVDEVDLEYWQGKLVFNVDVGDKDVKVDAQTGAVLASDADD